MEDHILDINKKYYSALSREEQLFLLFVDTRKAFDSIHHEYLFQLLEVMEFPGWVVTAIRALLSDVFVSPVLANDASLRIAVLRGVKQGCPLSPLLFILCLDPLLTHMRGLKIRDLEFHAAADDIALSAPHFSYFFPAMGSISVFSSISGLGINYDKSAVLPTLPDNFDADLIKYSPWPNLVTVSEYKHLGVLIGYDMTTERMFAAAHSEATRRLLAYRSVIRRLPVHKRIAVVNTFITPVYMYLGSYFVIPPDVIKKYANMVHHTIVPHGGSGFCYFHLPPVSKCLGSPCPLRDLWAQNLAAVALRYDASGVGPESDLRPGIWVESCLVTDHSNFAGIEMLRKWSGVRFQEGRPVLPLPEGYNSSRQANYMLIVKNSYQKSAEKDWPRKLAMFGLSAPTDSAALLRDNWASLPAGIPPYARTIFRNVLLKAIDTGTRGRFARAQTRTLAKNNINFPCPFCPEGVDDFCHFMAGCDPVKEAFRQAAGAIGAFAPLEMPVSMSYTHTLALAFKLDSIKLPKVALAFVIAFVTSLNFVRKATIARGRVLDLTNDLITRTRGIMKSVSSGARRKNAGTPEAVRAQGLIEEIPSNAITIFTDGSSYGNPGPSGAGAYVIVPGVGEFYLYQALGKGTNNRGEIWGVGMGLSFLISNNFHLSDRPVYVCTDSQLVVKVRSFKAVPRKHTDLFGAIDSLSKSFKKLICIWVPGHSGIYGNELGDRLACMGSEASSKEDLSSLPFRGAFTWVQIHRPPAV